VVPAVPAGSPLLPTASRVRIAAHEVIDLVTILVDHSLDLFTARACLWARICHSPAKPNVIANEVNARGILERVLYIRLLDLEVPVDIATVVRLIAFRHLLMLHRLWSWFCSPSRRPFYRRR
jgi:hypothetical protein